ncbi:MAG: exodeoxyribonuclease VII large subunit [Alphaproteobacteria bacterium]|nr:exodeoxyribonuclease VII large subunit [Alphaproteobacteria bacterium]MBU1280880.1 exodeoxyribonuclease VII large subunit [Alphaproteobacteria bacterium]MBU1572347.1 exodeoxyribonuclease VII large subunit [Alphaproteobacteria bacterium]MBU1828966.1 exodeoxyribonuclease VII large subunit [Alphaproteobacteria bacterium]MBU2079045.1 exodeoxyribonuclease VII large subunit [Alphaproteobacteria bacterium]
MSELFEEDGPQGTSNAPEFTVSELSGAVKKIIEGEFGFVRVRAEVGRVSRPRSGHLYFDLKDDKSVINAVSWKGQVSKMQVQPEEGMEIIATGRMTTFPGGSRYQIIVDHVEPAGAGALMAMLEKRKAALAAEGLFDPARKQPIPYLPKVIGVVTSPSGAVIRDILHRLRDRFPRHVLIWPVAVQGQNCAAEVSRAIEGFNALSKDGPIPRPDLIIVARGGGSVEDLWGFNEEIVVRAAAASRIPLISAVGHETDTTLIDFASDMRAPTPTAAAEIAVPVRRELWVTLQETRARMERALSLGVARRRQRLSDLSRVLPQRGRLLDGPRQRVDQAEARLNQALITSVGNRRLKLSERSAVLRPTLLRGMLKRGQEKTVILGGRLSPALARAIGQKRRDFSSVAKGLDPLRLSRHTVQARGQLDQLAARFERASKAQTERWRGALDRRAGMLEALSYQKTLERGYAVVWDASNGVVTSAKDAAKMHEVQFADGRARIGGGVAVAPAPAKAKKPKGGGPDQGSLF